MLIKYIRSIITKVWKSQALPNIHDVAGCHHDELHLVSFSLISIVFTDDFGQRALVGKVCMDRNSSVKHYKETSQESENEAHRWVSAVFMCTLRKSQYNLNFCCCCFVFYKKTTGNMYFIVVF